MEKVRVTDTCIGCGLCAVQCEKYFEINDEGFSAVKQDVVDENDKNDLLAIIEACPGEAIVIEEEK